MMRIQCCLRTWREKKKYLHRLGMMVKVEMITDIYMKLLCITIPPHQPQNQMSGQDQVSISPIDPHAGNDATTPNRAASSTGRCGEGWLLGCVSGLSIFIELNVAC